MITVGIDPDSDKYGVAFYVDGKLQSLRMMDIGLIALWIAGMRGKDIQFGIEDVLSKSCVYSRNSHESKAAQSNIGVKIGRCQQSQKAIMDLLEAYEIPYKLFRPNFRNWAKTKNKPQFEKVTGWQGKSNQDTRSAAFFGYLALQSK